MGSHILRLRDGATSWSVVDSETVVLDLDAQSYVGLNPVGTLAWSMLATGTTQEQLVGEVCNQFSVDREQAEQDLDAFLAECRRRGYLEESA